MKLACADFTWPLLPHHSVLALIRMLGVEGLDLGVFGNRSHVRPEMVRGNIPYWSGVLKERIDGHGLELADFFFQPWSDFETMAPNSPDPKQQEEATALFHDMLEMAHLLGAPGITMLPGVRFGDEPWDRSIRRSSEALKWRVDAARERNIRLSVEGHMGSNVDTPEKLAELVHLTPGLELTLDYTHFTYSGIADSNVEPLLDHARHFHCRGAAPGHLQTIFEENTIDYPRVIRRMQEIGYDGYFAVEYAWTEWGDFKRTDNTSETIQFRDMARAVLAGSSDEPPTMAV
jgi:sugar phosphate isomerase/epimerase